MKQLVLIVLCFLGLFSRPAYAQVNFSHTAPQVSPAKTNGAESVTLEVRADGIKRMRVLVQIEQGLKVLELENKGDYFAAELELRDYAELFYSFQYQTLDGALHETELFVVRKHSSNELEDELKLKQAEVAALQQRLAEHENTLQALKAADPKTLAKQRNVEMARAVVLLSRRERQVEEAERKLHQGSKQ